MGHAPVTRGARINGVVAHIRWAFYTAAKIEGYTVTRSKEGQWSLTATVVLSDAFKMTQSPLVFVAMHDKGEWCWPIQTLVQGPNHTIRATLGNPIE